jgi:hypothetical protein
MSKRIAVVYEAPADFRTGTELADRVLIEAIDWLNGDLLIDQRQWIGELGHEKLKWNTIARLATAAGIRAHGHIDGRPLEADAAAARRAIAFLKSTFNDLAAIVLLRDQDDQPERRDGLEQARSVDHGMPIVIGLAVVEREAWVISGFEPKDDAEKDKLDNERKKLGFCPQEQSHKLTADKDNNAPRSPKRVLKELTDGRYERQRECWTETPLDALQKRGQENGLAAFINEVRTRLAPLIGHVARSS